MMEAQNEQYKMENLVAMIFAENECWTSIVSIGEVDRRQAEDSEHGPWKWPRLFVDTVKGVWYQEGEEPTPIGHRQNLDVKYGLIGVYDRTNLEHLDSMAHDAIYATTDWSNAD